MNQDDKHRILSTVAVSVQPSCCRKAVSLFGAIVSLFGLAGSLGYLAHQPALLSGFPNLPPIALLTAIAFILMGIGIITIFRLPPPTLQEAYLAAQSSKKPTPKWILGLQWTTTLATLGIGVYCVFHHLQLAHFKLSQVHLLGRDTALVPTLMTSSRILLSGLALLLFLLRKHKEGVVTYIICPIGLYLIFTSLFALTGHLIRAPLLYNNMISVPASLGFILMGLSVMIGTIPFKGLFLPFFSSDRTSKAISFYATLLSLVVLGYGTTSIAMTFQYIQPAMLSQEAVQVFVNAEVVTVLVAILIEMLALRAVHYRNEAILHSTLEVHAAQTLQASEERYRFVIEGANDGVWDWDLRTGQYFWNDRAYEILDIDQSETNPKFETLLNRIVPEDRSHVQAAMQALLNQSVPYDVEYKLQLPSGEYRYCLSRGRATEWNPATGKPTRISGSLTDISALKKTEAKLNETRQMLSRVLEGSNDGVWEWNLLTNRVLWNDRLFEMLGLEPRAEIDFDFFESLLHPDDRPRVLEHIRAHLKQDEPFQLEQRLRHSSGKYIYCYARGKAMRDPDGKALLFSGTSTDITQLKESERALREISRKLTQSNQDLEHFATVASHDLKAPLRKISIFTAQVTLEKDKLSPESQDALNRIQNSIETMQTLIDDLLTWSKASWTPITMAPVALLPILERVLSNLKPLITEKDADIQIEQLDTVTGDTAQLEQLLQNLIENALKYQPPGQKPLIRIYTFCSDQGVCEISVQDNGIGIKPEYTERIFQPFERLHGKASPYPGTGVGLALCKRIVEQHNGKITVESKVGEGSCFTVRLPKSVNQIHQAIPSETPHAVSPIPQVDAPFQQPGN